jgi:hypothetical protein
LETVSPLSPPGGANGPPGGYRVLGVDPSLRATGWYLGLGDGRGLTQRIATGTLRDEDTELVLADRVSRAALGVLGLIAQYDPHLVVLEGPLVHGANRFPVGVALFQLIVAPLRHPRFRGLIMRDPLSLRGVVVFNPARLASLMGEGFPGKLKGSIRKQMHLDRYQALSGDARRLNEHQVDAWFLGHHGVRFWAPVGDQVGDRSLWTPQERLLFATGDSRTHRGTTGTPFVDQEGAEWWRFGDRRILGGGEIAEGRVEERSHG